MLSQSPTLARSPNIQSSTCEQMVKAFVDLVIIGGYTVERDDWMTLDGLSRIEWMITVGRRLPKVSQQIEWGGDNHCCVLQRSSHVDQWINGDIIFAVHQGTSESAERAKPTCRSFISVHTTFFHAHFADTGNTERVFYVLISAGARK